MTVGERIKNMRNEKGILQSELAKMLHVTQATVSSWEVNRTEPNMGMINRMCEVFGCTMSELLGLNNDMSFITSTPNSGDILTTIERNMESLSPKQLSRIKIYAEYLIQKIDEQ